MCAGELASKTLELAILSHNKIEKFCPCHPISSPYYFATVCVKFEFGNYLATKQLKNYYMK